MATDSTQSVVRYETDGAVAIITLDRPHVLNAFNAAMFRELAAALNRFQTTPEISVAVVTGTGDRAFSAGFDRSTLVDFDAFVQAEPGLWHGGTSSTPTVHKPMIAAIEGHCIGEGLSLALSCDLRICSESATFAMPEVLLGIPVVDTSVAATRVLGLGATLELLLLGEPRDAAWAHRVGLVNSVTPAGEALPAALRWAKRLAVAGPGALAATRETVLRAYDADAETAARLGHALRRVVVDSGETGRMLKAAGKV